MTRRDAPWHPLAITVALVVSLVAGVVIAYFTPVLPVIGGKRETAAETTTGEGAGPGDAEVVATTDTTTAITTTATTAIPTTTTTTTTTTVTVPDGIVGFVGGCDRFSVYAQNRWEPYGTAVRAGPGRTFDQVGSFAPNELVPLDGWVRTQPAYPHNTPPFDSDVWFHVADGSGWVSFAGVRADPTVPGDPFDGDGGRPAPVDDACSGTYR